MVEVNGREARSPLSARTISGCVARGAPFLATEKYPRGYRYSIGHADFSAQRKAGMLPVIKWTARDTHCPAISVPCAAALVAQLHQYYDCIGHTTQPRISASAFNPCRVFYCRLRHGSLGAAGAIREGAIGDSRRSAGHLVVMPRC